MQLNHAAMRKNNCVIKAALSLRRISSEFFAIKRISNIKIEASEHTFLVPRYRTIFS